MTFPWPIIFHDFSMTFPWPVIFHDFSMTVGTLYLTSSHSFRLFIIQFFPINRRFFNGCFMWEWRTICFSARTEFKLKKRAQSVCCLSFVVRLSEISLLFLYNIVFKIYSKTAWIFLCVFTLFRPSIITQTWQAPQVHAYCAYDIHIHPVHAMTIASGHGCDVHLHLHHFS